MDTTSIANSMYYTFSTIAQVLAAFLALSGVFLIFKLQELRKKHIGRAQFFMKTLKDINNQYIKTSLRDSFDSLNGSIEMESPLLADRTMKSIIELLQSLAFKDIPISNFQKILDSTKPISLARMQLIRLSIISMIIGVVTIIYSIVILSIVPKVVCIHTALATISIISTAVSIILMLITIIKALVSKLKYK